MDLISFPYAVFNTILLSYYTSFWEVSYFYLFFIYFFISLPQNTNNNKIKQNSNTKANKSGEEAQKKPWGL